MEKYFQILAVILGGVAAYFLWQGNGEYAFAAAVFGSVSFFVNIRIQAKRRLKVHEEEKALELEREEYFAELNRAGDSFIEFENDLESEKVEIPIDRKNEFE